uniref:phospholipase A2 n=1 Tax=Neogobius melanostomus TaxID=47308 RepID=A0A8C6TAX1_9GOBI
MTHVSPMVAVVLTLLTLGITDALILCTRTKVLPTGEVHYSFLRSDRSSHRLYHSIWSLPRNLLSCSFSDNKAIIRKYINLCHEDKHTFSRRLDMHSDHVFNEEELCTSVDFPQTAALDDYRVKRLVRSASQDGGSRVKTKLRVKRGFIVPGTLWCGSGNKAPSYSDLGIFSETDKCCREHDQCQDTILSFHSKFGVFNTNIFTMSHCDCDNRFHSCLKDAQDRISDVVGYTFFNLLKMHCFEFSHRLTCTERNWFGMCKESKMTLYAVVHPATLYVTDTAEVNDTSHKTTTATSIPVHNTQLLLTATTESTAATLSTHTPLIFPTSMSMNTPVIPTTLPSGSPNQSQPLLNADITDQWCAIYKYLDECRNRILPLQRKYGFRNNEPRTMYHCNCTDRLFQSLGAYTAQTEAQTLLLDHVSQACFVFQDCAADQICRVVVVQTQSSQAGSSGNVKEQRHLQVMGLRLRRPSLKRATNNRSPKLHRLCLRMVRRKVHKNRRHHTKETVRKKLE